MHEHQPTSGAGEATTATRHRLAFAHLDLPSRCDVCGGHRAHGNHRLCSQYRQQRWEAHGAKDELEAKKQAQAGRRRYERG